MSERDSEKWLPVFENIMLNHQARTDCDTKKRHAALVAAIRIARIAARAGACVYDQG
jgi:hypothetical protein